MAGRGLKGRRRGRLRRFNAGALALALVAVVASRVHALFAVRGGKPPTSTPSLDGPETADDQLEPAAPVGPIALGAPSHPRWRRGLTRSVASTALMVLVAAVVVAPAVATDDATSELLALTPPPTGRPTPPPASAVMSPPGTTNVDLSASPTAAPSSVGVPTRVDIAAIGVHASIVPLGLGPDGVIQVPDNFVQAGWYRGGPRPGDPGPAVILGHVDSFRGPAVFFELKDLQPGATITVTSSTGTESFIVDTVEKYPKTEFPTQAVYGPVSNRALRLVTCGGRFDESHHRYLSNVIVFATAAT